MKVVLLFLFSLAISTVFYSSVTEIKVSFRFCFVLKFVLS